MGKWTKEYIDTKIPVDFLQGRVQIGNIYGNEYVVSFDEGRVTYEIILHGISETTPCLSIVANLDIRKDIKVDINTLEEDLCRIVRDCIAENGNASKLMLDTEQFYSCISVEHTRRNVVTEYSHWYEQSIQCKLSWLTLRTYEHDNYVDDCIKCFYDVVRAIRKKY